MPRKKPTANKPARGRPQGSTQRKIPKVDSEQSARFIEAARTAGAAETKAEADSAIRRFMEKARDLKD